ncbi:MAG: GNAT family N-acetyltransferase [Bacteroidetes bacterium]|nr:GNAT family N-acetyltransferase [Bacteroidota bacterium]MBL0066704.1 GNAT family N-acetyltransferase [Bacteroidota bacterium]MBL0138644.1 GNAT family N-acetyltransferase [Bacteroidota bacterium]
MDEIIIRKGRKEDLSDVLRLVYELADFEKAPDAVTNTIADMETDGFGPHPVFEFYVAEVNKEIAGIALYYIKYSTWKGKGLYLDDLIVTEKLRGKGIGKKLLDAFMLEAQKADAKQVHWQVLDWNTPAIDFYKKVGASIEAEWLDCKMSDEQIYNYKP